MMSNANNHDERMRLVKTFAYEHVRFNHDPNNTYLVTDVTDDCMLELEGLAGLFAPHLFQRCNAQAQPIATTPPDFTEHPLRLVGQAERNGDLFLLFDGELGQHVLHQRTDDAEQWAAFTECSVGSITAREIYEAARPRLDHAANSSTTTEFTEQVRQLVNEFLVDADTAELTKRIASFAAEATEAALEQAAQLAETHLDSVEPLPLSVRIRALKPDAAIGGDKGQGLESLYGKSRASTPETSGRKATSTS